MTVIQRIAQAFLVIPGILMIVFYGSVYASTPPELKDVPADVVSDFNGLMATAGVALGLLVITLAIVGINSGERWAWLALWVLPAFFVAHATLLWIGDSVFVVLTTIALILTRPRYASK